MTDPALQPTSCTLDGPALRIRADEVRDLFGRALRKLEVIRLACAVAWLRW